MRGGGADTGWQDVFGPDEPVLWSGAPDRTRQVVTKYGIAALALLLIGPFLGKGGLWAAVGFLAVFFLVRAFWLTFFRVCWTRYAVTARHVAIRRGGHGAGWIKYPLSDYILQEDLGLLRLFRQPLMRPIEPNPAARLWYLHRHERTAALAAAGQVPRRSFHVPRRMLGQEIASLLPDLLRRAGVFELEAPPLLWQGRPASAPMVMPLLFPGALAMMCFAGALVAAIMGHMSTAAWAGAGCLLGVMAEVSFFRWQTRRHIATRYALAGRYAITLSPGLPFLRGHCDIRRISRDSYIASNATEVALGAEAFRVRGRWVTGAVGFHKPPDAARLLDLLRDLAASDPRCAPKR